MDHYYSENPNVESDPTTINVVIREQQLTFTSDRGVFSKGDIDFGTRVLLESFEWPTVKGGIGDIGCGWGPIGVTLAKENSDRSIVMVDVNERAVELAKNNAKLNRVGNVEVIQSSLFSNVRDYEFATILTNPPIRAGKKIVHQLFEEAYAQLLSGGELWVVIQKKQGAPSAKKKLEEMFDVVEVPRKEKGYFILNAKKY